MALSFVKKGKINILKLVLGEIRTNTYLVYGEDGQGFLVDPADSADIISIKITDCNVELRGILLTHGHFDHVMAADEIRDKYGVKIFAHEEEREILESSRNNLSAPFTGRGFTVKADVFLKDEEEFELAGFNIKTIHTPGHTCGSVCYLVSKEDEKVLISGDTLFAGSCGRYDFPTGSYSDIIRSIKEKLLVLDDGLEVFPGHNEETTIAMEKTYY